MNFLRRLVKSAIPSRLAVQRLPAAAVRSVLLTFDDGPHPEFTPGVLDRLEAHQARGLFFVIGRLAEQHPSLLRQIVERGHFLGNHSYSHADRYILDRRGPAMKEFCEDVARCQALLEPLQGDAPRFFRPPGGRLTMSTLRTARRLHLRCMVWSNEIKDWSLRTPEAGRAGGLQLAELIQPADIVLLHDDHAGLHSLLDVLLPRLREREFDLYSGPELV